MKSKTTRRWLPASALALTVASVFAHAQEVVSFDQRPAIESHKAAKSLLQKLVRIDGRLLAVGERGHIVYSDDSGASWKQARVPTRAMLTGVHFPVPTIGWAVGYDGLVLKTEDSGSSWAIQLDGNKFARARSADAKPAAEAELQRLSKAQAEVEAALSAAEEAGTDTEALEAKLENIEDRIAQAEDVLSQEGGTGSVLAQPLMDVWFKDLSEGFAVGAFGEFLQTTDGGYNWTDIAARLPNPDHYHLNAISGVGNTIVIVGESGSIFRSKDGGVTWVQLVSPDEELGSYFAVALESPTEMMIGGLRGSLYRSEDAGNRWTKIEEDLHKNMNGVYFAQDDVVIAVGNEGALLLSKDGGKNFDAHVRSDRLTITSVVEAKDGAYVLVGAGGAVRLQPDNL